MYQRSTFRTPTHPGHIGRVQLRFYDPDPGVPAPAPVPAPTDDLKTLLAQHKNDAVALAATLYTEISGLRSRVPAAGSVVLDAAQATAWTAYQALGTPDLLTTQLKERETFSGELSGLKREKQISDVAGIAGYKASVLQQLPGADKLTFEVRESTVDGKPVKSVIVKDGTTETALDAYAKSHWADFLPSLVATTAPVPKPGTTFPAQNPGGTPPASTLEDYAKQFQAQRDAAANPLAPAAPLRAQNQV